MIIYLIVVILSGISVFFAVLLFHELRKKNEARKKLLNREERSFDSIFLRWCLPVIEKLSWALDRHGLRLRDDKAGKYSNYISINLVKAGLADKLAPLEVMSYQIIMAAAFILVSIPLPFRVSIFSVVFAGLCGFAFPILWLKSLEKERRSEITYELPQVLDLLTLSVEAGLDFISAAGRIVEKGRDSVVVSELGRALNRIRLGKTRSEALQEFKYRMQHKSINSFVAMLLQADRLGASIGPILKAHAAKLRSERFQLAERAGVIAAQKILIPLIFCIMPAVFIVVFGPIVVMWRTGAFNNLFGV